MIWAIIVASIPRLIRNDVITVYPFKRMCLVIVTDFSIFWNRIFDKRFFSHYYSPLYSSHR